jgi:hypothetical protein
MSGMKAQEMENATKRIPTKDKEIGKLLSNLLIVNEVIVNEDRYIPVDFVFIISLSEENFLTLTSHFNIRKKTKTIAVMSRGIRFHAVAAMSGWCHEADSGINI